MNVELPLFRYRFALPAKKALEPVCTRELLHTNTQKSRPRRSADDFNIKFDEIK